MAINIASPFKIENSLTLLSTKFIAMITKYANKFPAANNPIKINPDLIPESNPISNRRATNHKIHKLSKIRFLIFRQTGFTVLSINNIFANSLISVSAEYACFSTKTLQFSYF